MPLFKNCYIYATNDFLALDIDVARMSGYSSARIPKPLFEKIEQFLEEHPEMGYRSVSEFVNELLRRELEKSKAKK